MSREKAKKKTVTLKSLIVAEEGIRARKMENVGKHVRQKRAGILQSG